MTLRSLGKLVVLAALAAALVVGCTTLPRPTPSLGSAPAAPATVTGTPHNVVLLIGDGMGVSHVTAARIEHGPLNMERLPVGGLIMTFSGNRLVTDSAASGTAYATGEKTYNGAISVSMDGKPLKTVLEYAEERGMATGLVATCSVIHATPAVFASHVDNREKDREIAMQMAGSGVDVLFGGGWSFFVPESEPGGARRDGRNLLDELRTRMPVALSADEFRDLPDGEAAAAFFAPKHPGAAATREPSLSELTVKALTTLSRDEDGFFLMVEGSQIDWAAHENDHEWLMDEMADFDEAVAAAVDFAARDGRTLVVVTADHETGAYAVHDGSLENSEVTRPGFGSGDHSAAMVPIFAFGPGAEALGGMRDNTHVGRTLIDYVTKRR